MYTASDIATCSFLGIILDSAAVRSDGRPLSPAIEGIYDAVKPIILALHPSIFTDPVDEPLPNDPRHLKELPEPTKQVVSQAVSLKHWREASASGDFPARFDNPDCLIALRIVLPEEDWNLMRLWRRLLALFR